MSCKFLLFFLILSYSNFLYADNLPCTSDKQVIKINNEGDKFAEKKEYIKAISKYKEAFELCPDYAFMWNIARCFEFYGIYQAACSRFSEIVLNDKDEKRKQKSINKIKEFGSRYNAKLTIIVHNGLSSKISIEGKPSVLLNSGMPLEEILPLGYYNVSVEEVDYYPYQTKVMLCEDKTISVTLQPQSHAEITIMIVTNVFAAVYMDDIFVDYTQGAFGSAKILYLKVTVGKPYKIEINSHGYFSRKEYLTFGSDEDLKTFYFDLTKQSYSEQNTFFQEKRTTDEEKDSEQETFLTGLKFNIDAGIGPYVNDTSFHFHVGIGNFLGFVKHEDLWGILELEWLCITYMHFPNSMNIYKEMENSYKYEESMSALSYSPTVSFHYFLNFLDLFLAVRGSIGGAWSYMKKEYQVKNDNDAATAFYVGILPMAGLGFVTKQATLINLFSGFYLDNITGSRWIFGFSVSFVGRTQENE